MKRLCIILFAAILGLLLAAACVPLEPPRLIGTGTPDATRSPQAFLAERPGVTLETGTPTAAVPATEDPYAALHADETAIALRRQELDQQQIELQMQILKDSHTSTAGAQQTSTTVAGAQGTSAASTQVAGTQSAGTQTGIAGTQSAGTRVAGTQTAAPLTQTVLDHAQEDENLKHSLREIGMVVWSILVPLAFVAFAVLGWDWLKKHIQAKNLQNSLMEPDKNGRFKIVPEDMIPGKSKRLVNPNLAHRAVHDPAIKDDLSPEQALGNAHDQRRLEGVRSISESPFLHKVATSLLKTEQPGGGDGMPPSLIPTNPLLAPINLPDWRLLNQWNGQLLPYGADENQKLLTVDPARRPHLMVTGTTGTGKTRYEIRTIVAGALTSGWQVIVVGKQADYIPFEEHPNVTLIPANAVKEPEKYIRILKSASEQMFKRDDLLVSKKLSTWDRYGAPQTLIVVDDYSAAMFMMPKKSAEQVLTWALALAMDGRKYGLNLLLGLQRASWTCISPDLRSQMARITLRVESARESQLVLGEGGAETLPERHFLARLGDDGELIRGAAFAMSDAETYTFLQSRPVQEIGQAEWIDTTATNVGQEPVRDIEAEIHAALANMMQKGGVSLSQVQRDVFGDVNTGGANFRRVQKVWAEMQPERATTTGETGFGAATTDFSSSSAV